MKKLIALTIIKLITKIFKRGSRLRFSKGTNDSEVGISATITSIPSLDPGRLVIFGLSKQ